MKNTRTTITEVRVRVEVQVVGSNGEYADMTNPQGLIYNDFGSIEARTEDGRWMILKSICKNLHDDRNEDYLKALAYKIRCTRNIDEALWSYTYSYGAGAAGFTN